jgi:uncharacterized protein YndB with AHSA1/START domain
MNLDTQDDSRLTLERTIPTSPQDLFQLWVDPTQVARWWAPDGYQCLVDSLDARPGGRWRTILQHPSSKQIAISGVYRTIEPPRLLTFTWAWEDEHGRRGHETEVRVIFSPVPGGTRLLLIQQAFENKSVRDRHNFGWSAGFDRLTRIHATT